MLPATIEKKTKFLLSKKVYSSFRQGITVGKCKTKAIQTDLGTFKHNRVDPGIIQAYSGIFKNRCNPGIFRTVVYPEPWHVHNPGIFRTSVYSECWYNQTPRHIQNPAKHL